MKKLAYMFLLVGSLLVGANVANGDDKGANKKAKTRFVSCSEQTCQIKALLSNPDIVLKNTSRADVKFDINEYNVITVNDVRTDNPELKQYIMNKMNGSRINGNEIAMKDQKISLIFRTEKQEHFVVY